jgi:S-phase kinase-associated protein 1
VQFSDGKIVEEIFGDFSTHTRTHTFEFLFSDMFIFFQVSKEGDVYEVPIAVAKMSTLVATTIDDDADDDDEVREIPLPNVKDAVLTKVIEYCTHYKDEPMTPIQTPLKSSKIEDLVQPWYANFVKVEQALLFELVTAANFMDIKPLLDLTCLAVSVLIKVSQSSQSCSCFLLHLLLTLSISRL